MTKQTDFLLGMCIILFVIIIGYLHYIAGKVSFVTTNITDIQVCLEQ